MLIFAASDKGGTGRSVISCNMAYRRALQGEAVAFLDFDFGSPTAGSIFDVPKAERGVDASGLHSYFTKHTEAQQLDTALHSDSDTLRDLPRISGTGRLVLLPGDRDGGEFSTSAEDMPARCARLFLKLDREFDLCIVDLSAGRSYAVDLVLEATARPELASLTSRWLVFHRWTKQHILAAHGLVFGERGLLKAGERRGHDPQRLTNAIRYVRTAVVDLGVDQESVTRPAQGAWLRAYDQKLREQADKLRMGRARLAGQIPYDPMLQWSEQVIDDSDVSGLKIANEATVHAFEDLAAKLSDERFWEGL